MGLRLILALLADCPWNADDKLHGNHNANENKPHERTSFRYCNLLRECDAIPEHADAFDVDFHHIALIHAAGMARRARVNHVPGD
jgi:hypothetical protein